MTPRLCFANLCADVSRCIKASKERNGARYTDSLDRAYKTLHLLRTLKRPEAYEEGLLLLRALEYARFTSIDTFEDQVNDLAGRLVTF